MIGDTSQGGISSKENYEKIVVNIDTANTAFGNVGAECCICANAAEHFVYRGRRFASCYWVLW